MSRRSSRPWPGRSHSSHAAFRTGHRPALRDRLYAFIGHPSRFPSGRHTASFLGLTPREYSSGLRRFLGRISKRGDAYLRMLLMHGARSVLWHAKRMKHRDHLRSWALRLERKVGHNKAAAALANKLARITRAVWKNDRDFEIVPEPQAA